MATDAAASIIGAGHIVCFVAGSAIPDGLVEDERVRRWRLNGHGGRRLMLSWAGGAAGIAAAETKGGMEWEGEVVEVSGYQKVG